MMAGAMRELFHPLHPYAYAYNSGQGIFPHYLRNRKFVNTSFIKLCRATGNWLTHFPNIIHTCTLPTCSVIAQLEIKTLVSYGVAGKLRTDIEPDIIIAVGIRMPKHYEQII